MSDTNPTQIHATGEATGFISAPGDKGKPITVIGTNSIRAGFDATCLQQALNARSAPGVTDLVLNPDAHAGYGAPVGCVLTSPTHVYPGPVGVDIKCSMSFLQLDLTAMYYQRVRGYETVGYTIQDESDPPAPGGHPKHAESLPQ